MKRSIVGSLLRTTQAYCALLCEKHTLDSGIAYHSERFATLPGVNQMREVVAESSAAIEAVYSEGDAFFRALGLACDCWAPVDGQIDEESASFLEAMGFEPRNFVALALAEWVDLDPPGDVRILPARAMRAALRATVTADPALGSAQVRELAADAMEERLNDPQYDMFVAQEGGAPVGRCALFQVGDIARVVDIYVVPDYAGKNIGAALILHVLGMAKRLAMSNICTQVDASDEALLAEFHRLGFTPRGEIVEFHRVATDGPIPQ